MVNNSYAKSAAGVSNGGDLLVDGSNSSTGAVEVTEFGGDASCDVYREFDPDGDGTFEVSVLVTSTSGRWHTQKNEMNISASENSRLRINNTSGGAADLFASGFEVTD